MTDRNDRTDHPRERYRDAPPPHPGSPAGEPTLRMPRIDPASVTPAYPPAPARPVPPARPKPTRGWRRGVHAATFGLVNLGPSRQERRQAAMEAMVAAPLRGHYKIGVLGKGGVGKTTVAASVGCVLAELRRGDRVVAVDADTAFGRLGSRIDPRADGSYWELAKNKNLQSFAEVLTRMGSNSSGLFVLAGENGARRGILDPAIYREATMRLDRHFTISIVDCGSTMDAPVTQEAMRDMDALIVVSSPWPDGASAAAQTMEWLAAHGKTGLMQRTVIVLNDSDGHSDKRTRGVLADQFRSRRQAVVEVPFDPGLRPGGVINSTSEMSADTRGAFVEVAAVLSQFFATIPPRGPHLR